MTSSQDDRPMQSPSPQVVIETSLGSIIIAIELGRAPITGSNFLNLLDEGFFEGADFYRAIKPAADADPVKITVVQGGFGRTGRFSTKHIPHESTRQSGLTHTAGAVSMARYEPGSASSEFFIVGADSPELDHGGKRQPDGEGFAVFGKVISGMDVVSSILQIDTYDGELLTGMLVEPVEFMSVRRRIEGCSG